MAASVAQLKLINYLQNHGIKVTGENHGKLWFFGTCDRLKVDTFEGTVVNLKRVHKRENYPGLYKGCNVLIEGGEDLWTIQTEPFDDDIIVANKAGVVIRVDYKKLKPIEEGTSGTTNFNKRRFIKPTRYLR